MTTSRPKARPNDRYTLSESCRLLGISPNTFRKYLHFIDYTISPLNGRKSFKGKDIVIFWEQFYKS